MYEFWFREAYKSLFQQKKVNLAIRPGDRRYPRLKGAREGQMAKIRILKKPGDEEKNIQPIFDKFETRVIIKKIVVKKIAELSSKELKTCSPDCQNKEVAKYQLGLIYNREFTDADLVSLIYFDYIN